jgi:hypothetical protein
MRKRLQLALMASPAIAALLSLTPYVQAASNASITTTTDDSGHKVYVNDVVPSAPRRASQPKGGLLEMPAPTFRSQQNRLVFWSTAEHRWKTVPHANVRQTVRTAKLFVAQWVYATRG